MSKPAVDKPIPTIHASVVSVNGWGVAICGASGSGKSDLALRLIDRGATLVGDDYVYLENRSGRAYAKAVASIAGRIEARGIGILDVAFVPDVQLRLMVALPEEGTRYPEGWPMHRCVGFDIPVLHLNGFHASAPLRVEYALKSVVDADIWPVPSDLPPLQGQGPIS